MGWGGTESAGIYTFSMERGMGITDLVTGFFCT
jgi:hypothetical protein